MAPFNSLQEPISEERGHMCCWCNGRSKSNEWGRKSQSRYNVYLPHHHFFLNGEFMQGKLPAKVHNVMVCSHFFPLLSWQWKRFLPRPPVVLSLSAANEILCPQFAAFSGKIWHFVALARWTALWHGDKSVQTGGADTSCMQHRIGRGNVGKTLLCL